MFQPVEASLQGAEAPDPSGPLPSIWESHVYQLDRDAAASLGFGVGSVTLTANTRLLVLDTARVLSMRTGRRTERWGCGFRLVVEVSDIDAVGKLALPAIAASVEVGNAEASVTLEVKGYKGDDLWEVIPPPAPLDVDSYKNYLEAAARIQKRFQAKPENLELVLIARSEDRFDILIDGLSDRDLESAAVIVRSLYALGEGAILATALENVDEGVSELVEHTYRAVRGADFESTDEPTDLEAAKARGVLSILRER